MQRRHFSQRMQDADSIVLSKRVRRRIRGYVWSYRESICKAGPLWIEGSGFNEDLLFTHWWPLENAMSRLHGTPELGLTGASNEKEILAQFLDRASPGEVLDLCEVCHDEIPAGINAKKYCTRRDWQNGINEVFQDADLPWRMLAGRIVKLDSDWVDRDIYQKALEILDAAGFEGPLSEFMEARDELSAGKAGSAIRGASNALESTAKAILGVDRMKPGKLFRRLIDSGLVPEYHEDFLKSFEQILLSAPRIGNQELGARHGGGAEARKIPMSLAKLAVHLAGVLIIFLIEHHLDSQSTQNQNADAKPDDDALPF